MPKLVKVSFVLFVEDQNKLIAARPFNKAKRKQISLTIEKNNQATGKKKSSMFTLIYSQISFEAAGVKMF